jgi:hypothetical protein
VESQGRKTSAPRRPEGFPGTARAVRYYLSGVHSEDLIQIYLIQI